MVSKRVVPSPNSDRNVRKELEFLYWRRSTINALIRSLEQYSLFRSRVHELHKRRIA